MDSEVLVSYLRERSLSPNWKVLRSYISFSSADNSYFYESELAVLDIWASVLSIPATSICVDFNFTPGVDSLSIFFMFLLKQRV